MAEQKIFLSLAHIQAACFFAKSTYDLEKEYTGKDLNDEIIQKHSAYSIGSIITAVSYLEATINELFFDVANRSKEVKVEHLPNGTPDRMKDMWEDIEKSSMLDKYEMALILAEKQFDKGKEPYQSVQYLIKLRNELVHYHQKLREIKEANEDPTNNNKKTWEDKLEKFLDKDKKIKLNPLTGSSNPFFPDKCLGYGCAFWAIQSSVDFTKDFFQTMGLNFHNAPEGREPYFMKAVEKLLKVNSETKTKGNKNEPEFE
ncbi:conserved hypothetical protein [Planktothrix serta PCC 8927]|uniref:HEPN domain-containing protein n=1 Tax=Planktothrix serta PCC 8927 TaxID=671068 RepID=A0A7Z9E193_9CYAN|nr:hypothetical protein [Planktothrix serta]VXD22304.1 conserved hypothetical protein [Planktothrix serta PCC 8927]